jgi:pimeloyl-ACP methyl ester carboxylesterase
MRRVEFEAADGSRLKGALYQPSGRIATSTPLTVLMHGLASSRAEWYGVPRALAKRGHSVVAFDLRGHGDSDGPRGVQSLELARQDVESVLAGLEGHYGVDTSRVALVGHSMGASLAISMAMDLDPVRTVVALAPPSRIKEEITGLEKAGYFVMHKINAPLRLLYKPGLRVPYKPGYERLYASRRAVSRAKKDDFLQHTVPVANYSALIKKLDAEKAARSLTKPTLVLIAEYDAVVGPWNSRSVFAALATRTKKLVVVPESGHSMAGDHASAFVVDTIDAWLKRHLDGVSV